MAWSLARLSSRVKRNEIFGRPAKGPVILRGTKFGSNQMLNSYNLRNCREDLKKKKQKFNNSSFFPLSRKWKGVMFKEHNEKRIECWRGHFPWFEDVAQGFFSAKPLTAERKTIFLHFSYLEGNSSLKKRHSLLSSWLWRYYSHHVTCHWFFHFLGAV